MNRPSSAFGLLLGFLALTMFAVSSTTRSTSIKPAAGHADRSAIRRQAAVSRLSALAAAADTTQALDLLDEEELCVPDSIEAEILGPAPADSSVTQTLRALDGPANVRLASVQLEPVRDNLVSLDAARGDGHTSYDPVYDRVVLGISDAKANIDAASNGEPSSDLSAAEIASVFQSVMEKSTGSRNATRKSPYRASLDRPRTHVDAVVPTL